MSKGHFKEFEIYTKVLTWMFPRIVNYLDLHRNWWKVVGYKECLSLVGPHSGQKIDLNKRSISRL